MTTCPFPGMDPWLENTDLWQGFHNGFVHYVQDELQERLPANYVATLEMRVYFEPDADGGRQREQRVPDLEVVRTGPSPAVARSGREGSLRRGAVLELNPQEYREGFISLREVPSGRLVTSIELLSPTNKEPSVGREEYLAKQWRLFGMGVNLIEMDLLRGGMNTVLASAERLASLGEFHYLAGVFRAFEPLKYEALTWSVRESLPSIPVPLDEGVDEIPLDLARVFSRTYRTGGFRRILNYGADPRPPLAPEDAAWADALLRAAGLREDTASA
jgi:hypothetical protein